VTSIIPPAEWAAVQEFSKAARATFADIRKHRPPHATCRAALRGFLDAIRVARCRVNPGYMTALGLG
jgi:translation initiation factor 2B subunit (eIF-2B alpha/beta/delta family)